MHIPFHRPYITDEEITGVVDSLRSGWLTMGPKTRTFEEEFSAYVGARHAVALSSCTAALHLSLKVIGLHPDDEVLVPTMTFAATAEAVCYFGAKPVLVDVQRDTGTLDPSCLERAIGPKTRVIMPVHYAGQSCDMDEIMEIARRHGLYVIEDAAHSLPAWYRGKKIGTVGDLTCFSFYVTKTLSTGEGGMVTTHNDEWADRIRILRLHGISHEAWKRYTEAGSWYYEIEEVGYKYNMTDIQAALGISQLRKIEWMWEERRRIADKYTEAFENCDLIVPPCSRSDRVHAWHLYVIGVNIDALSIDRKGFVEELKRAGVMTSVHFIPLHFHPYYRETFQYRPGDFPNAEWMFRRIISLPIYPGMKEEETDYVIDKVMEIARTHAR